MKKPLEKYPQKQIFILIELEITKLHEAASAEINRVIKKTGKVKVNGYNPEGIAIDTTNGFLYIVDHNSKISKFNLTTGVFIGAIGETTASTGTCPSSGIASTWCSGGTFLSANLDGSFPRFGALKLDSVTGYLYVGDSQFYRVDRIK